MSRYRILPTPAQQAVLRDHCSHARYVWNLAVEQHSHWHPGQASAPGYLEQCRQLTQARAENPWLAAGSQTVQLPGHPLVRALRATPALQDRRGEQVDLVGGGRGGDEDDLVAA